MSIFDLDADDKKAKVKLFIAQQVKTLFTQLQSQSLALKKTIWHNSDPNLTPAVILEILDTDGAQLFALSQGVQTLLNTAIPNSVDLNPEQPITVHPDGTVTLAS